MRPGCRWIGALVPVALLLPSPSLGHAPPTPAVRREVVRLQGSFKSPAAATSVREITVLVRGERKQVYAVDWLVLSDEPAVSGAPKPPEPTTYILQGEPRLLERFSTARPDQTVTILAERRPGSGELFLLAVDRCPP